MKNEKSVTTLYGIKEKKGGYFFTASDGWTTGRFVGDETAMEEDQALPCVTADIDRAYEKAELASQLTFDDVQVVKFELREVGPC